MKDPRFPHRPDHPDFWMISEALIAHDAMADQGEQSFEDLVARYIDVNSLNYAASQQAAMYIQAHPGKHIYGSGEVRAALAACFTAAFIHGMRTQHLKATKAAAEQDQRS